MKHDPSAPHKYTNALAKETSPYLLQHAHNPVNWYPWGPEAFAKARKENKPIFLSVGYSSCHWCHVMERESFENEEVAKVVNDHFIAIKVDREERPDVDEIYMTAVQALTQRGGWPMSVFMTAEGKPFYGGTYYPAVHFKALLERIDQIWRTQNAALLKDADNLAEAVHDHLANRKVPAQGALDRTLLEDAVESLHEAFDPQQGGFGGAPKFPPNNGFPILIHLKANGIGDAKKVSAMTTVTLDAMALGGIHDHLGGGFHRYSTDAKWLLPHFEKMLYDNAMLSRSYAEASVVFANPEYERVARDVYDWVLREMTSPEGAFYSTLDADSEGEEGKFYVWSKKEVEDLLGADAATFCAIFNIRAEGNFKEEATGHAVAHNIPHLTEPLAAHAKKLNIEEAALREKIGKWKSTLMAVRVKRVWPGLDDKILTAWNGLMIASFAKGSIWLKEPRYKDAAVKAADFLLKNLRTPDGRWLATHRHGQSKLPAYLDDHAFLAVAFLDLHEATGDARWKTEAIQLVDLMDKHFLDKERGGYYFTADDHEKLLTRTKDVIDKAIPSGNGWVAQALVRLAELTGEARYSEQSTRALKEFQGLMERAPQATESILLALAYDIRRKKAGAGDAQVAIKDEPKVTRGPVTVDAKLEAKTLKRGAAVPLTVRFVMADKFHIQAREPKGKMQVVETRFTLASKSLGNLVKEKFPQPETLKSPELGGDLLVYSKEMVATATLEVGADAPLGRQALRLKVQFQACDDKQCDQPHEVVLSIPVEVTQ